MALFQTIIVNVFLLALTVFTGFFVYSMTEIGAAAVSVSAFMIWFGFVVVFQVEDFKSKTEGMEG